MLAGSRRKSAGLLVAGCPASETRHSGRAFAESLVLDYLGFYPRAPLLL